MNPATCESTHVASGSVSEQLGYLLRRMHALFHTPSDETLAEAEDETKPENEKHPSHNESYKTRCQHLAELFGLSSFELDILLLCAAAELEPETCDLCSAAQSDSRLHYPTFQLVLGLLAEPRWSATLPSAALRRWRLIEIAQSDLLMTAQLSIAEPVLHFLMGAASLDERLSGLLHPIDPPQVLPSCYRSVAGRLAVHIAQASQESVIAQLCGNAVHDKRSVAAAACASLGLRLCELPAAYLPSSQSERENLQRLLERDAALAGFALLVDIEGVAATECSTAALVADCFAATVILCGNATLRLRRNAIEKFVIDRPAVPEQRALWAFALGEDAASCGGHVDRIATQFSFDSETILRAGTAVRRRLHSEDAAGANAGNLLIEICGADAHVSLDALAQHIETKASWADIVLPESSLEILRAISAQVRQQGKVLERWGFAAQTARGLGISALFHGLSGTGKTLAAEVLAHDLGLDLFRIDLSQMVSKYVGETEKNLRTIFDSAENTGSVLLFDEADALFGKRSEVRDSHDRYANIEVSYLLQRIESYRGLAILTTNLRAALDSAFLRRISFFVSFPFPDQQLRRCIWERVFPAAMPAENVDFHKLSRLNLPGGNIRNIALNAAYIAADLDQPVRMEHLLTAARRECAKLERPLTAAETGGWV